MMLRALLDFISRVPHEGRLRWNGSDSACVWVGVGCDATNASVYSLRLPGVGLVGYIPVNTLGRLTQLRVLSLRSNRLSGSVPADFAQLKLLGSLYLQGNQFSGEFPGDITWLSRMIRLDLSSNNFSGPIPFSINNLTHLTGLFLGNNSFSGKLPSAAPPSLLDFNVANNDLNGSIPTAFAKFPAPVFAGNVDLCGGPLPPCNPFFPSPAPSPESPPVLTQPHKKHKKLSTAEIIAISVAGGVLLLLLILALIFLLLRKRKSRQTTKALKPYAASRAAGPVLDIGTSSSKDDITGGSGDGAERNKLAFFNGNGYSFDLEDLLRALAEVLGNGSVGTSYKAVLEEGTTVAVKRLKDVAAGKKEFEQQMQIVGNLRHENLLPLRAYYY